MGDRDWKISLGMHNFREAERVSLAALQGRTSLRGVRGGSNVIVPFEELPFNRLQGPSNTLSRKVLPQLARTVKRMRREKAEKYKETKYEQEAFGLQGGKEFQVSPGVAAMANLQFVNMIADSSMAGDSMYIDKEINPRRVELRNSKKARKWITVLRKLRRKVKKAKKHANCELLSVFCTPEEVWEDTEKLASLVAGQQSSITEPLTRQLSEKIKKKKYIAAIGRVMLWDNQECEVFLERVKQHGEVEVFKPGNPFGYGFQEFKKWNRFSRGHRIEVVTDSPEALVDEGYLYHTPGKVIHIVSGTHSHQLVFGVMLLEDIDRVRPSMKGDVYVKELASFTDYS